MSDVRARLAEALWERLPKSEVLGPIYVKEMADVLADAALSLPGIAIVDTESVDVAAEAICATRNGSHFWGLLSDNGRSGYRKAAKAAFLAAANAAESVTK